MANVLGFPEGVFQLLIILQSYDMDGSAQKDIKSYFDRTLFKSDYDEIAHE